MKQALTVLTLSTKGRGLTDITSRVREVVTGSGLTKGLVTLFVRHTSASLLVQENADPAVQVDLERFFARLVPDGDRLFSHDDEGPDDMPAHVRSALTQTSLAIPFDRAAMVLGTWQAIYLYEHRTSPHRREVAVHVLGE